MDYRKGRLRSGLLCISLISALFIGTPTPVARATVSPTWRITVLELGESDGSYVVSGSSINLSQLVDEFGFSYPELLLTNSGDGWGDCNADGDILDDGDFDWPTPDEALAAPSRLDLTFCGGEEVLFPKRVDGATISVIAGAGSGDSLSNWNGTSLNSAITGASGSFAWDGADYFGDPADPDGDGAALEAAELTGSKVVVSAPGFGVAAADLVLTDYPNPDGTTSDTRRTVVSLRSNGRTMEVVNAFGGQTTNVVADGAPCTFYATTSTSPSVWRSFDCGGTWSPVVLSSDERAETTSNDGIEGMDKNQIVSSITTSGRPGEVAVVIQSNLWFSRDFGTSWNSFPLNAHTTATAKTAISGSVQAYWAHAFDESSGKHSSYLFLVSGLIGGPAGALNALTVYATVMPTGDEYSIVDNNLTGVDDPCDGTTECATTEIRPGQFFALDATQKDLIAGGTDSVASPGTWTGWLFNAKPGEKNVYVATQQGAAGGTVITKLPQISFTTGDLKTALSVADNFTAYDGSNGETAELYRVRSPWQATDIDGCANGCTMSRDMTVTGGQAAADLMVFGGPIPTTGDYRGPSSVVIWDREQVANNSSAAISIASWITADNATSALNTDDDTDHWETAASTLEADSTDGEDTYAIKNDLYSRNGNSALDEGCLEEADSATNIQNGRVGQANGGGDAGLECQGNPRRMEASCGENTTPPVGSVAPMFGVADAAGYGNERYIGTVAMIRSCLIVHAIRTSSSDDIGAVTGSSLGHIVVMDTPGANNNTGSAFDAGFDFGTGDGHSSVVLSGDGARGLVKAATWKAANSGDRNVKFLGGSSAAYRPLFPSASHSAWNYIANRADPGTRESSGGFAVNGLAAPVIRDTAFNPSDPDGVVATFSFTGGGRSVISYDGGQTYYTFAGGGSNAISWWKGANSGSGASEQGTNWILSGSFTGGGFAVAHFTDEEWLDAKSIANGTTGDSWGDLSDGIQDCVVSTDAGCYAVDFDQPVEGMAGSELVVRAIREQRPNPGDPGEKTQGCSDAANANLQNKNFDGNFFGLSGGADTVSITGIQGTNWALVMVGQGPSSPSSANDKYVVVKVEIEPDGNSMVAGDQPCINDMYYLTGSSFTQVTGSSIPASDSTQLLGRVASVAYCPIDGSSGNSLGVGIADSVEDTALIVVSDESNGTSSASGFDDGGIIKIKGLYQGPATVTSPTISATGYKKGDYRDLKMDCDTGLVFAIKKDAGSGTTASTSAALYSLDGATTFAPMGFASAAALKAALASAETIAVEADPTTGVVEVVVVASGGSVISIEMDLEEMMPAAATLADLNDELSDTLTAVADDPSAEGDVSTVNDPASADGFYFGGEKPGDIDYPASEDEAPDLTVDGTDSSEFASAGFGIMSVASDAPATPIFGSGGGALDVTAKQAVFSFGNSLTVPYMAGQAAKTITGWHQLPVTAVVSGATQTYAVASASSAYCEVKSSGGRAYMHIKKPGTCKVGITVASSAPYLAGTNYYVYTLSKGTLGAPSIVPTSPSSLTKVVQTLGLYADDANTDGYQATSTVMPKIKWSEVTTSVTASKKACVLAANKLTLTPVAADAGKSCKIKGIVATSTNWGAWTVTYTITFP